MNVKTIFSLLALLFCPLPWLNSQIPCIDSSLIVANPVCPLIYDPVCGCDGVTYGNFCEATLIGGVTYWTPGACNPACSGLTASFETTLDANTHTVGFFDLSSMANGQVINWAWNFGDGTFSSEQNPTHTYAEASSYVVCLKVDALGDDGVYCQTSFCQSVYTGVDCFDNCLYEVAIELDGIDLRASLSPALPDTPFFFYVLWSLDNGASTGTGLEFYQAVNEPGRHVVCATYPTGDFSPETCTVCKAFETSVACINPAQIDSVPCPLAFIPVCGCDGITYNNACEAENWAGVSSWTPGVCGSVCNNLQLDFKAASTQPNGMEWTFTDHSLFPGGQLSSWYWDFGNGMSAFEQNPSIEFSSAGTYQVCLSASGLFADGTQCGSNTCQTIQVGTAACVDTSLIDPNIGCTTIFDPVCGCDGNTYSNSCVAMFQNGITSWTPGVCPSICINPAWIDTLQPCFEIYDPVCGCDGVTYVNDCYALNHGVGSWKKGMCCDQHQCRAAFSYEILPGNKVLFKNQSVNGVSYALNYGDGNSYTGGFGAITHQYAAAGIYQVCLTVNNSLLDCEDTYCLLLNLSLSGVEDVANQVEIQAYPNPVHDGFFVETGVFETFQLQIFDTVGGLHVEQTLQQPRERISVDGLPAGIYWVKVSGKGAMKTFKIIVQP